MRFLPAGQLLFMDAPAAMCVFPKAASLHFRQVSAVALTFPIDPVVLALGNVERDKAPISKAGSILQGRHEHLMSDYHCNIHRSAQKVMCDVRFPIGFVAIRVVEQLKGPRK